MKKYLRATDIVDWKHPKVIHLAGEISRGESDKLNVAKRCFEWVRDKIRHSYDYQLNPVTCTASEVLIERTGYCYAKSHLLAALLRANSIPAGICYQRLSRDENGAPFCLHGLNAVYLKGIGWYRIDPRGNKAEVDTQFDPPVERLAFRPKMAGEIDIPVVFSDPLEIVIEALRSNDNWQDLYENLPDLDLLYM